MSSEKAWTNYYIPEFERMLWGARFSHIFDKKGGFFSLNRIETVSWDPGKLLKLTKQKHTNLNFGLGSQQTLCLIFWEKKVWKLIVKDKWDWLIPHTVAQKVADELVFRPFQSPSFFKSDLTDPPQIFHAHLLENTNLSLSSFNFTVGFISRSCFESDGFIAYWNEWDWTEKTMFIPTNQPLFTSIYIKRYLFFPK